MKAPRRGHEVCLHCTLALTNQNKRAGVEMPKAHEGVPIRKIPPGKEPPRSNHTRYYMKELHPDADQYKLWRDDIRLTEGNVPTNYPAQERKHK